MLFVNSVQAIAWKKIRSYAFPTFLVGLSCMPLVVSIISGIHVGKWFSIRAISPLFLPPGNVWLLQLGAGRMCYWQIVGRHQGSAKQPAVLGQSSTTKNYLALNVGRATVEKPCFRLCIQKGTICCAFIRRCPRLCCSFGFRSRKCRIWQP